MSERIPVWLIYLTIFLVAFLPRALALDAFVAPDEGKWIYRSAHFLQALLTGELAQTTSVAATPEVEVLAPAVPTMWTGAVGLVTKFWIEGSAESGSLSDFLAAIPSETEKIPLHFYPWTRFPTVLLTSLSVLLFYVLLARLIAPLGAFLAAIWLALDPFFISMSRVIHHDALVSIFIVLSLLLLLLYRQRGQFGWLLVSGFGGGLALSTKPTALYLVLFVGLFLLFQRGLPRQRQQWQRAIVAGIAWGVVALITFVAVWPAMWVAPLDTLAALAERSTSALSDENNYSLIPAPDSPLPELGFLYYPVNWLLKATLPLMIGLIALIVGWQRGWFKAKNVADENSNVSARTTISWLLIFALLFLLLLIPADTRDIRYFLPAVPPLYALAAVGILAWLTQKVSRFTVRVWVIGLFIFIQLVLAILYYPYFVDYWNPALGGPWLAPHLVKIGSGEGLDQMGRYLDQKPHAVELTVAVSYWESFAPFFTGNYTKAHYDDEADYILIYRRQVQNSNPFPEYWTYFSARRPEHKVSLGGMDYAWLYPGPQLRVVREAEFGDGLALRGYRLARRAAQPGEIANLTLVWAGATPELAGRMVEIELADAGGHIWAMARGPILAPEAPSPVEGHYALDIPADMPRGDYELWVWLPPADAEVGTGSRVRAGQIPVRYLDKPPVELEASTNFGGMITFGGADLGQTTLSPGQTVDFRFVWQARQPMVRSFTTFTHIVDEAGQIWAQADRIPEVEGVSLPTNVWEKGEWIVDTFQLALKSDTPTGNYTVLVGVYDSQTLERLPVGDLSEGQTVLELTSIKVR